MLIEDSWNVSYRPNGVVYCGLKRFVYPGRCTLLPLFIPSLNCPLLFFFQLKLSLTKENEKWSLSGQFSGYIISGVDTSLICFTKEKQSAEVRRTYIHLNTSHRKTFLSSDVSLQHCIYYLELFHMFCALKSVSCNAFGIILSFRSSVL